MDIRNALRNNIAIVLGIIALLISVQLFVSCGQNYEKPATTETESALISAATLSSWIDAGLVNGTGYDKVVILDITTATDYTAGHIPGAYFVDSSEISQTRNEGVGASATEVPEGAKMDALIQKYGIDGSTTIVFTGKSLLNMVRTYYTFRYWGFPKSRLKVLDGGNGTASAAGTWWNLYGVSKEATPPAVRSSFSVRDNRILRSDLRVSLSEMIEAAKGNVPNVMIIDGRGTNGSYAGTAGSTSGAFAPTGDYPAFEGRIRGARAIAYSDMYDSNSLFYSVDNLRDKFTAIGLDSTKTAYVYCRIGQLSSYTFFALDGILGWPVALYDGSWLQWGSLGPLVPSTPSFPSATADYITSGLLSTKPSSTTTFDMNSPSGEYVINGTIYTRASVTYTYPANSDTYDDLDALGSITQTSIPVGDPAPTQTADTVRIQKVTTDSSGITAVQDLRIIQPNDYVVNGLLGTKPSSGFAMTSPAGQYVYNLVSYVRGTDAYTYPANSDIYDDLDNAGATTHIVVGLGASAPSVTANSIRIQKVSTNSLGITAVTDMRTMRPDWVVSGLLGTAPSTKSFIMTSPTGTYVIRGTIYNRSTGDSITYPANMDTYDDIDINGVTTHTSVSLGSTNVPTPPVSSIRIQKVSTDSKGITAVTDLRIYPTPTIPGTSQWRTDALSENVTYDFERGKAVEMLSLDGSTCSGSYSVDGAKSYSPSGCTFTAPKSDDVSANQIEEADEAYMNTGASKSTGGGGGSVPQGC